MVKAYRSTDIKSLGDIDHIRLNSGMYIGDTSNPVQLIEEALDNGLDECLAGYVNIIAIIIDTKERVYSVLDNGRGIPIDNPDVPVLISSKLFTGAKFQNTKTAYEICSGRHGVGLVAVNALSTEYKIEVYRENKHAVYLFEGSKLKRREIEDFITDEIPFATKIEFKPDPKIFETTLVDIDRVRRRLFAASVELPDCTFVLLIDKKKEIVKISKQKYFEKFCISKDEELSSPVIEVQVSDGPENLHTLFCYTSSGSAAYKVQASVNLLPVEAGGSHINMFFDTLKEILTVKAKKHNFKFQPSDCLSGLRAYLSLTLKDAQFGGQTKEKLLNKKENLEKLYKKLKSSIESYFSNNEEILVSLLEQFEDYRRRLDSKRIKGRQSNGKRASTKFTKLRDCTGADGELFIVEGDSAGGTFVQCRDPRKHAIFPLKGKIPSVVNMKDILKNKEISELVQALGTGVGPSFDLSNLKYDKIICATDADADGAHIACLLTAVFANLLPDIVKDGRYYLVRTPLYAISDKKNFIPIWTKDELEKARKEGKTIQRYKGLGELNPSQLKIVALDDNSRKLIPIQFPENLEDIMKLFSEVEEKRRLLEDESIEIEEF